MHNIITKFDHRTTSPDPHIVTLLGEIDTIRGEFRAGLRMTPQAIISLRKSTLITSAGALTRIEGAKLTPGKHHSVTAQSASQVFYRGLRAFLVTNSTRTPMS